MVLGESPQLEESRSSRFRSPPFGKAELQPQQRHRVGRLQLFASKFQTFGCSKSRVFSGEGGMISLLEKQSNFEADEVRLRVFVRARRKRRKWLNRSFTKIRIRRPTMRPRLTSQSIPLPSKLRPRIWAWVSFPQSRHQDLVMSCRQIPFSQATKILARQVRQLQ